MNRRLKYQVGLSFLFNKLHQLFASISTKSLDNYELKEDMIKAKENDINIYRRSKD
jgi:hypothetical protein